MKRATLVVVVTLLTALGFAQPLQPGEYISKSKLVDGTYWQTLDEAKKEIWLRAYVEGVTVAEVREAIQPQNLNAEGNSKPWPFSGVYYRLVPKDMTWVDAVRSIDDFYRERENLGVLVSNALEVTAMRSQGVMEEKIKLEIVQMRRAAAKNTK